MLNKIIYDEKNDVVKIWLSGNTTVIQNFEGKPNLKNENDKTEDKVVNPFKKERLSLVEPFDFINRLEDQLFVWFNPSFEDVYCEDVINDSKFKEDIDRRFFEVKAVMDRFFNIPLIIHPESGLYKREILKPISKSNFILKDKEVKFEHITALKSFLKEDFNLVAGELNYLVKSKLYSRVRRYFSKDDNNGNSMSIPMRENFCIVDPSIVLISKWYLDPLNDYKITEEAYVLFYNKLYNGSHQWIKRSGKTIFKTEKE